MNLLHKRFLWIGILTTLIYLSYLVFYWQSSKPFDSWVRESYHIVTLGSLVALYGYGYRTLQQNPISIKWILIFSVFFGFIALFCRSFYSGDIHGYINRGWQQLAYGLNPYVTVLQEIPNWRADNMFTVHWRNNPCPYGFFFALLAKGICALGFGYKPLTVVLFKSLNLITHLGIGFLIYRTAQILQHNRADCALYLYLWNPLIIMQSLVHGHNDILMAGAIALAMYFIVTQRWLWVLPTVTLGILIKYAALVVMPLLVVNSIRIGQWKKSLLGLILSIGLFILTAWPFIFDFQHFKVARIAANATLSSYSLHAALIALLRWMIPNTLDTQMLLFAQTTRTMLWVVYGLFYLWLLWGLYINKKPTLESLFTRCLLAMIGLVCFASSKYYPWYVAMFFPMAFFLPSKHLLRRYTIQLSLFQLLGFTFVAKAHVLNFIAMTLLPLLRLRPKATKA